MANQLDDNNELKEQFIIELMRSEVPIEPPADLLGGIMGRISQLPAHQPVKPYRPPLWLKTGIPVILMVCLVLAFAAEWKNLGIAQKKTSAGPVFSLAEKLGNWFSELSRSIQIPAFTLPDTIIWILSAAIILFWAFAVLNHYLSKHLTP